MKVITILPLRKLRGVRFMIGSLRQNFALHIYSLIFAFIFQLPDWPSISENIYGYPMIDRSVYSRMLLGYNLSTDYRDFSQWMSYFTDEFLWNIAISYLNRELGFSPDFIFSIVSTLVLWQFSFHVLIRIGWRYLPLICNPLVVDFAFSQLRLAAAIAFVSFFWNGRFGLYVKLAATLISVSIHSSMSIFGSIYFLSNYLSRRSFLNLCILIFFGFFLSFAVGPLRGVILSSVGDRRVEYPEMQSTLLYLSFWLILWVLLLVRWKDTVATLDGRFSLIVLSIVFANVFVDGYSTRFIVAAFPSVLISMAEWRSRPFPLPVLIFLPYAVFQWLYWLSLV